MRKALTVALGLAVLSTPAFGKSCDIDGLRNQFKKTYTDVQFPIHDEQGNVLEVARVMNFKTSENVLLAKYESFIVGTFDITMKKETHHMTVVANVDTNTCTIEPFNQDDMFGSSVK